MNLIREFVHDYRHWGRKAAVWNFRFMLGSAIGGFTRCSRAAVA